MNQIPNNVLVPDHIEYILINKRLTVVAHSAKLSRFIQLEEEVKIGQDIREQLPELIGYEENIAFLIEGKQEKLEIKGICRTSSQNTLVYIDILLKLYREENLIVFIEDVSERMKLEQKLVQSSNETQILLSALSNSNEYIDQIISFMADALIVTDELGVIKSVNGAAQELFGYSKSELLGKAIDSLFISTNKVSSIIHKHFLQTGYVSVNLEVNCQSKVRERIIVAFSCSTTQTDAEIKQKDIIYVGRNITERKRSQQRLEAQYAIASILSQSASLEEATPKILPAICERLEWDVGELWIPLNHKKTLESFFSASDILTSTIETDSLQTQLQRIEIWSRSTVAVNEFIEVTGRVILSTGVGLAGRVWTTGSPQWITNIINDPDFGEESFAVKVGLHSAFAFPIQSDAEVVGVMTFFSSEPQPLDQVLLETMIATGNQLGQFFKRKQAEELLRQQQKKTESLLINILPEAIAERLKQENQTIADSFEQVTVLFADIVNFTDIASSLSPIEVVEILNVIFSEFDRLTQKHELEKIKTIGDAYMVVGGLPIPRADHAEAIAEMALDIQAAIACFNTKNNATFKIRIGINSGSVVAGVIGTKKFIYDLWGDAVNLASRMESQGVADKIQVTASTYALLQDKYQFQERGSVYIKGKGIMTTYFLTGRKTDHK